MFDRLWMNFTNLLCELLFSEDKENNYYFCYKKAFNPNEYEEQNISTNNAVDHPTHYTQFPVEVIDITRHLNFCLGNTVKYILRAPYKNNLLEDYKKAHKYMSWEMEKKEGTQIASKECLDNLKRLILYFEQTPVIPGFDGITAYNTLMFLYGLQGYLANNQSPAALDKYIMLSYIEKLIQGLDNNEDDTVSTVSIH